jgi:hypothetical protein
MNATPDCRKATFMPPRCRNVAFQTFAASLDPEVAG